MLNKLSPFFAVIFSYFFLKEKLSPVQIIALIFAFIGSLFIIKPNFLNVELMSSLIGLGGGICAGFAYTMVRKLGNRGQSGISIVFFFSAFSSIMSLIFTAFVFEPMTGKQVIYLILAGIAALGGQLGITNAYINAPAKEISIYDYSQIIFATIIGFIVFGQIPDAYSFIGYIVIILMAFLMFHYHKKKLLKLKNEI
jgi:drug/metabolite transporter (DMT)-like permease